MPDAAPGELRDAEGGELPDATSPHAEEFRDRSHEQPRAELPEEAAHDLDLERIDQVARALTTLTRRERQVLVLRYWGDLTEQQTAVELGLALGTVKSTAHRALAKLRTSPHLRPESFHDQ